MLESQHATQTLACRKGSSWEVIGTAATRFFHLSRRWPAPAALPFQRGRRLVPILHLQLPERQRRVLVRTGQLALPAEAGRALPHAYVAHRAFTPGGSCALCKRN